MVEGALYLNWDESFDTGSVILPQLPWNLIPGFTAAFDLQQSQFSSGISFCLGELGSNSFGHYGTGTGLRILISRRSWTIRVLYRDLELFGATSVAQPCLRQSISTISVAIQDGSLSLVCHDLVVIDALPIPTWHPHLAWSAGIGSQVRKRRRCAHRRRWRWRPAARSSSRWHSRALPG